MAKSYIIYEGEVVDDLPRFYVDNFGGTITFHIYNENTSSYDLTDCTVVFRAKDINNFEEYLFTKTCSVTDAESGYCNVTLEDGDLDTSGSYNCSLLITKTGVNTTISLGYLDVFEN